jgi:hypothetical protein
MTTIGINITNTAMGIMSTYEAVRLVYSSADIYFDSYVSYFSISLSLNLLLTLMIVTRLILYRRNIRNAMGASGEFSRTYNSVITMIVESYAPYAVASLVNLALFLTNGPIGQVFNTVISYTQVCTLIAFLRVHHRL